MSCFLKALNGNNDDEIPVWFMRQAGRYLPSYQEIRSRHALLNMFKTPSLAHKITLLPFQDLDLDAGIIFSDILVVFEALGFEIDYPLHKGPQVFASDKLEEILNSLNLKPVESVLSYVGESIELVKKDLKVPLLGFSATPFTLLAYLLEKPMTDDIKKVKRALYEQKENVHALLNILTHVVIEYVDLQVKAGIDAFQLFDTASTWLSSAAYLEFDLPYITKILEHLKLKNIPSLLFSKSSASRLELLRNMPLNALSVDWTSSLKSHLEILPSHMSIQGNLDPYLTTLEFSFIKDELTSLLEEVKGCPRYIFNLGHGVFPETKLETLQKMIGLIKSVRTKDLDGSYLTSTH